MSGDLSTTLTLDKRGEGRKRQVRREATNQLRQLSVQGFAFSLSLYLPSSFSLFLCPSLPQDTFGALRFMA